MADGGRPWFVPDLYRRKIVAGVTYANGQPTAVTGYPIHQGLTTRWIAFVELLTADGEIVPEVQVAVSDLTGARVRDLLSSGSDEMLWRIADRDFDGLRGRMLAELAYRERGRVETRRRAAAAHESRMRASEARLVAGAR